VGPESLVVSRSVGWDKNRTDCSIDYNYHKCVGVE